MDVTAKLAKARRLAVGLGLAGATLVWSAAPSPIDADVAVASAQDYLDREADDASLSFDGRTWTVSAGAEQVILDAQTGEPLEFVFR